MCVCIIAERMWRCYCPTIDSSAWGSSCQPRPQHASRAKRPLRGPRSRSVAPRQGPPAVCKQVTDWTRAATQRTRQGKAMRPAGPGRGRRSCFRSCRRRALGFSASAARPAAVTALAQQRINAARWKTGRPRRADNNPARQPWWQQAGGGVARGPVLAGPEGSRERWVLLKIPRCDIERVGEGK